MKKYNLIITLASIFCALAFVFIFAACSHDDEAASVSPSTEVTVDEQESTTAITGTEQNTDAISESVSISAEPSAESIESTDAPSDSSTTSAAGSATTSSNSQSTTSPASQSSEVNNTKPTSNTQPTVKPQEPSSEKATENTQKPSQNTNNNGGQPTKPSESAAQPSTTAEDLCKKNGHKWGETKVVDKTYTSDRSSRIVFDDGRSILLDSVCSVTFHSHIERCTCQICGEEDYSEQLIVTDLWKHPYYPGAEQSVKDWFEQFYIGKDCAKE